MIPIKNLTNIIFNITILGPSCVEGMAGSKRIRNLMIPLIDKKLISLNNLIYRSEIKESIGTSGEIDNIKYTVIGYKLRNIISIFKFFLNGLYFLRDNLKKDNLNIIYNYGSPNIENIFFILYGKFIGYKVILDIVEDDRYEPTANFMNKLKAKSALLLLKYSAHYSDALIGISDHLYQRLLYLSKDKIPVFLIPISVNLNYFTNNANYEVKKEFKIFYGGSFNEKDGLEYLIEAFNKVNISHRNTKLIITGSGIKPDLDKVIKMIDNSRSKDNIIFKGFLSTTDYYKLLNECDIFCMTRDMSNHANTGFPFKLGEFLASGKAVIATNVGDISKYLVNNVNALVIDPNSANQISEAISSLLKNPDKIKSLGIESRKTAESYFDSEKVSKKLYSILQSI